LLYGKGDPITSIQVDQDAVVFTMGYAVEKGIWPRKAAPADGTGHVGGDLFGGGAPQPGAGSVTGEPFVGGVAPGGQGGGAAQPLVNSIPSVTGAVQQQATGPLSFAAEGVLKEALKILWEKARSKKVASLARVGIAMYDAGDAFRLLGAVGAVPGAKKTVVLNGGYETTSGSTMTLEFEGTPDDAKPVKDFIEPQLRAAKEKSLTARFAIDFDEGLSMSGDAAEKLAERLSKFASGAAYVSATAEAVAEVTA